MGYLLRRLYAAPSPRLATEQFIELWDCDLFTLPGNWPAWFERQQAMVEEDRHSWHAHGSRQDRGSREQLANRVSSSGSIAGSFPGASDAVDAPLASSSPHRRLSADAAAAENDLEPMALITPMRIDGPLVLPGTKTSTVDRED